MKAADHPLQRPANARLLVIDAQGRIGHRERATLPDLLRSGDLVVANDAATLPASLHGRHTPTGAPIEIRLAAKPWLLPENGGPVCFVAVAFGAGDFTTPTEDRPLPPALAPGDRLQFGTLEARVEQLLDHPRLVSLRFDGAPGDVWAGLSRQGRPIQYAHMRKPLRLWDVWTPIAGLPVAFEPPSAGFALDWKMLGQLRKRGAGFATLTHAAGISSTGDSELDRRLPFPEIYRIPEATVSAIERTREAGGRVIAIGTTVVRALEHAAMHHRHNGHNGHIRAGNGLATQRIGADTRLQIVDVIVSGTHEADTSHYQLLRAFTDDASLRRADAELETAGYRTHEFGDSVWIERRK